MGCNWFLMYVLSQKSSKSSLLYFSIFCFILYKWIRLYVGASRFILSSVFIIPVATSFSSCNCFLNISNGPSTLYLFHIRLYILVFPVYGSLLFAFLIRILWLFYVFVRMRNILFVHYSFYMCCNYFIFFLFFLGFLDLCVVLCIFCRILNIGVLCI